MKRFFILYALLFVWSNIVQAQGEIDNQEKIFYRNEKSLAIMLNSNGIGVNGRYAERLNAANKILYDLDISILKHPKEVKRTNSASSQGYVLGKQYFVVVLRPGYGKQVEIYRKFDIGGISIRRFHSLGPSFALLKPVYYQYQSPNSVNEYEVQRYNGARSDDIIGKASFFKGVNEVSVIPGAYLKVGLSFEYSRFDQIIHSIDVGAIGEGFIKKIPIMATKENYQTFITLYVSYRFGKVVDPNARKKKATKEDFLY